jgi:hypothetical protein
MARDGSHSLELAAAPDLDDDGHARRTGTHRMFLPLCAFACLYNRAR